jgi:hypothetical protein
MGYLLVTRNVQFSEQFLMTYRTSRRAHRAARSSSTPAAATAAIRPTSAEPKDIFVPDDAGLDYYGMDDPLRRYPNRTGRRTVIPEGYGFSRSEASAGHPLTFRVAHALALLSPDCDHATWKERRLLPLAHAARRYPEFASDFLYLAKRWSSGALMRKAAAYWDTPDPDTGATRRAVFADLWVSISMRRHLARDHCIGTIYFDAEEVALKTGHAIDIDVEYDQLAYYFADWRFQRDDPDDHA